MGMFASFATGFLEGTVDKARIEAENEKAKLEAAAAERERYGNMLMDYLKTDNPDQKMAETYAAKAGVPGDFSYLAKIMEDADKNMVIGGVEFPGVELKGTESMYNSAIMEIRHMDQLLAKPEFRSEVEATIKGKGRNAQDWVDYLTRLELKASDGYEKDMRQQMGDSYNPTVHDFDISLFSNINRLHPLIGTQLSEAQEANNLKKAPPVPDGTTAVMFEVNLLDEGSRKVTIPFNNDDMPHLRELAANANMTVQEFVSGFNDLRDLPTQGEIDEGIYEGLTDQEIAIQQYGMLKDVVELKKRGFYNLDLMAADGAKRQELVSYLTQKYGSRDGSMDRYKAATVFGYLMPTPEFFTLPGQTYVFASSRKSRQSDATMNSRLFLEKEMNYSPGEIKERIDAAKYSKQTVLFLDRLYDLETNELADETGAARVLKRVIGGAAIQAGQIKNVFASIFGSDGQAGETAGTQVAEFEGNYKKNPDGSVTTKDSLMKTAARVASELEMDLANITEADALKLTLAARMARAIDPSGRLSNQDFEVQLRRLGNAFLGGPEDVKRNLEILAEEFQREVQANIVFEDISRTGKITPRKARTLLADQKIGMLIDADIDITGDSQQQTSDAPTQDGAGQSADGRVKFEVGEDTRIKQRDDRIYVDSAGKEYDVFMTREGNSIVYIYQDGSDYFKVDKSGLKQKENQ